MLYPADFASMLGFLSRISATQLDLPLRRQPVPVAVLMAFQSRLSLHRIFAWKTRRTDRMYRLNLPTPVAVALYHELQTQNLTPALQNLLNRLDQAMVDYRQPMSERLALTTNLLHAAHA